MFKGSISWRSRTIARTPLVDHELIEFAASLPAQIKFRGGVAKYLLKKLAQKYLPHDTIYRPKQGFSIPVDAWLHPQQIVVKMTDSPGFALVELKEGWH